MQTYRQARDRGESELTAFNVAADAALALGRPLDKFNDTARADRLGELIRYPLAFQDMRILALIVFSAGNTTYLPGHRRL